MSDSSEIIEITQALKTELPNLIGEQAKVVMPKLDELLASAEKGQPINKQIRSIIRPYPILHKWFRERLASKGSEPVTDLRSYDPLPSPFPAQDIPVAQYICPQCVDGNPYSLRFEGGNVPDCEIHKVPRVLAGDD